MGDFSTPYTSSTIQPAAVLQQQDRIIQQQDQSLEQLSRSVGTLNRMGQEIRGELAQQSNLLDDLERGVDQTRDALVSQNSRLKRLIKRGNCKFYICIGACRSPCLAAMHPLGTLSVLTSSLHNHRAVLLIIGLGVALYYIIMAPSNR